MQYRAAAAAALATAVLLGTAGCNFVSPQRLVETGYDPSDGVGTEIGDLAVRNALLVAGDDGLASLEFVVSSSATETTTLIVGWDDSIGTRSEATVQVPAGGRVLVSNSSTEPLLLEGFDTPAGALFPIYFTATDADGVELPVPVLDDSWTEYATLAPTPGPVPLPTALPGAEPQVEATSVPEQSVSPTPSPADD